MTRTERVEQLVRERFPDSVEGAETFRGDLTLRIRRQDIRAVAEHLRTDPELRFDLLIDLCGVDRYRPGNRFEVIYILSSITHKLYLRLSVELEEENPVVDSVTTVWPGANWHERETFDMYGIRFEGHPDLRRMYMPEDFAYHPLRKDFPLMGIPDSIPLPRK
jgi:NADH-quinone oxidoreductase subunit C